MEGPHGLAVRLGNQSLETGPWAVSDGFATEEPRSSSSPRSRSKLIRLNSLPQSQSQSHTVTQLSQSTNGLSQSPSQARPFDCPWKGGCNKRFNRKSDLQRHFRIHTNERPYSCKVPGCGKSFIQRSALTVHHRTHSGEKPHVCEVDTCGKRFSDSSSLARHRRIHTGKRPYKCHVPPCEKSFCRKTTLTKHAERSHREVSAQHPYLAELDDDEYDDDVETLEEDGITRQNSAPVAPRYSRNLWLGHTSSYPYVVGELNGPRASSRPPYDHVARSAELIGYPHPDLGMGQLEDLTVHQRGPHPSLASQMPVQNESYFRSTGTLPHLDTTAMSRSYPSREAHSITTSTTTQSPEQFLSSVESFQSSPASVEHEQILCDIPRTCANQPSLSQDSYANVPANDQFQQNFGPQHGPVHYPQMHDLPLRNAEYGPQDVTTQEVSMPIHIQMQPQSQESIHYESSQISPQQPILYHNSVMPSSSLQPSPSQMQPQQSQPTPIGMDMAAMEQQRHYDAERQREEQARQDEFMQHEQQRQQEEALQAQQVAIENSQRQQREKQALMEDNEAALKSLEHFRQQAMNYRQQQQQQQQVRNDEPQYAHEQPYHNGWAAPEPCVEAVPSPAPFQQPFYSFPHQPSYDIGVGVEAWKNEYDYAVMPSARIPDWDAPC